ncbi:polysaccharide deacetylase family protein [Alkaliphilus transvaalensis]|uniref:polysaccharide deacetylase family protein n=1 Tax=Alkaliphilus transvaalensis TaxID=114628 RepID=UPI000478875B|nr:polysaccharide deacetylase family protein [Alkaliphilus transvaalensis]
MKGYLKTIMILLVFTIVITGLLGFRGIPFQTAAIVDGGNVEKELVGNLPMEDVVEDLQELPDGFEDNFHEGSYEDLVKEDLQEKDEDTVENEDVKVAYLTFDDGPSPKITPQILDILKDYDIKATFFVIGDLAEKYPDILLRIHSEGHLIANHTYSHNYKHIYSHPKKLIAELEKTDELFTSILGSQYKRSSFMRFPGGSFGEKLKPFRQAVTAAGYINIDWNVVNGDAEGNNVSPEKQLKRLQETLQNKREAVILMHDSNTKQTTVDALPDLIEYIMSQGYVFEILDESNF